mmetsp:Transcript_18544/g.31549  ORF Transcript_18544/g.31549 Transcript_18544/m.31549 type:complete len:707 (-) Transcript_18544:56-2176(-)
MVKPILATTLVAVAAASISSQVAVAATEALGGSHQEEDQRQLWGGLGWPSDDDDDNWSSSGKSGKSGSSSSSSSSWGGNDDDWWSSSFSSGKSGKSGGGSSSSSWDSSSSGKSGKSGSSGWSSSSSSSSKSGKSKHEVYHGGWGKPGWWGAPSSSGKSGKSGSSSSSSWSSSGKSGKSGSSGGGGWSSSSSSWSSSGKSGKSGSGGGSSWSSSGKSGKSGGGGGWSSSSSSWSSSGKSGKSGSSWGHGGRWGGKGSKSKGSKSKGSKSKSSKGGYWAWTDSSSDSWKSSSSSSWSSSSGKSGKSGSSSGGGGWYGKNDDDWAGSGSHSTNDDWASEGHSSPSNHKPSKPSNDDDWAGGWEGGHTSSSKPEPASAPTHPTGWKDDGWDADEYYKTDIEGIRQECNALIEASERELLPKIVRMVFHDCVGTACDGCINIDNVDNRGLREPIDGIFPMVQKYRSKLSRADIWAICAMEAASMAVPGDGHHFPLHYIGRKDCADGDEKGYGGEDHAMCSNDLSNHDMLEFFANNFGMHDPREVVVVMGFHSASTVNRDNSGFGNIGREDGWVENADEYILSNKYYQSMKNFVWELQRVENVDPVPTRYQWYFDPLDAGPIMTNSDMSLLFDFDGYMQADKNGVEGLVMCLTNPEAEFEIEGLEDEDIPLCPMAESTKEFVDMYADDNDLFIKDFGPAMNKILNWGYHTYD